VAARVTEGRHHWEGIRAGTRPHGYRSSTFAIVKFNSRYCRIWTDTVVAPSDGTFVWFVWRYHRYYHLPTLPIAQHKLNLVVARHLCGHE
jgi:hypothetical protein